MLLEDLSKSGGLAGRSTATPETAAARAGHDEGADGAEGFAALPARDMLQRLHREAPFAKAVAFTTLPRGGLQAFLPSHADEAIAKGITRGLHAHDAAAWRAIGTGEMVVVDEADVPAELRENLLAPLKLGSYAALPLAEPVLPGYPGVLLIYRDAKADGFGPVERRALEKFARQFNAALRQHHPLDETGHGLPLAHDLPGGRVFALDAEGNAVLGDLDGVGRVSERLRYLLEDTARRTLSRFDAGKGDAPGERAVLTDDLGDQWAFRMCRFRSYPALGVDGPVVFAALQPGPEQWAALRPGHFPADEELARLVPALKFMHDHYAEGPGLEATAKVVHLSPFHFHRRFTESLGITPKHFLFDCQIAASKAKLLAEEPLAQISDDCGFAHQSHFTSRFKQATGLTPTRWRRLARERAG